MTSDRKLEKTITQKTGEKMSKMGEKIPIWNYTFTFADLVNLRTQTGFQHSFLELFLKVAPGIIQVAEFQLITYLHTKLCIKNIYTKITIINTFLY